MTGHRGPAPPEVHVWDAATGRCDRSDCAEIYARCPAHGMPVPYNASGWRLNNARFAGLAPVIPSPKAPRAALSPPVSERARQKRARRR